MSEALATGAESQQVYEPVSDEALKVIDYANFPAPPSEGKVNITDEQLASNVRHSITLGHPQVRRQQANVDRVVMVGSGPSLKTSEQEIVALVHEGAKLVTMNGSYRWALERNLRPSATIIMDGRATNARFLDPPVPHCRYLLASQCHPDVWKAVEGRPNVWIFHAAGPDTVLKSILDEYYLGRWDGIIGGTTVFTRGVMLLRTLGYLRFDVFGVDSCWMDGEHHAFPQEENAKETRYRVQVETPDGKESRSFECAGWHVKQAEDFLQTIKINGHHFLLNMHGDGMLAYMLRTAATGIDVEETRC